MSQSSKEKSVRKLSKTFRKVFSQQFLKKELKRSKVDRHARKLFFVNFLLFLLLIVMLRPSNTATRELETKSNQWYLQRLSGMPKASHSSIANRIARIPPNLMDSMLRQAQQYLNDKCHWKDPLFPKLKVFDTTTFSVSPKHFEWAAANGKKSAARFVFIMDHRTGGIDRIIDAHETTSDNTVFAKIIREVKPGETYVFDRGYNRLTTLKEIVEKGSHFVTRWTKGVKWKCTKKRKLRNDDKLERGWLIVSDEEGIMGSDHNPGQMKARKIVCYNPEEEKEFVVLTSNFRARAGRLVRIYVTRWPIEVYFRHLKSTLRTVHFPTQSPEGVHNWLVIVALSIILIEIMTISRSRISGRTLGDRHHSFIARCRTVEIIIMNEAFISAEPLLPWPPPRTFT